MSTGTSSIDLENCVCLQELVLSIYCQLFLYFFRLLEFDLWSVGCRVPGVGFPIAGSVFRVQGIGMNSPSRCVNFCPVGTVMVAGIVSEVSGIGMNSLWSLGTVPVSGLLLLYFFRAKSRLIHTSL